MNRYVVIMCLKDFQPYSGTIIEGVITKPFSFIFRYL